MNMTDYTIYLNFENRALKTGRPISVIKRVPVSDIVLDFNEEYGPEYSVRKIIQIDGDKVTAVYPR